ncbi:DUF917 family protein [Salinicoccus sp. ID82-1]|uniref:DUF917 domain-containing protein n=1 Tax=Salinicoccus sp. ID82-1 TaxID=2820269 RepID=UPI001F2CE1D4|nr:DUF917 family protein [Salinicoccus sp. ID82-1]MCG1009703.1 DUF917 family protein [Salinicoccus sp. ID82-1]
MSINELRPEMVEPLVVGGSILGGGGGGAIDEGLKMGALAFEVGQPSLMTLDELEDDDMIITVSAVGAPAAKDQFVQPLDYVETIELIEKVTGKKPKAMITNENGGIATINGFFQSAVTGIPILDVSCNGRAHPTGVMGSMQLNIIEDYESFQTAVGGRPGTDFRLSQTIQGSLDTASKLVRQASISAGGFVAVARNPVTKNYLASNGAVNALSQAYDVGVAHQYGNSSAEKIDKVVEVLKGKIVCKGAVESLVFETVDGFDLGKVVINSGEEKFELTIWNEYMTCENDSGKRLATFPDLLMTFESESGDPITSAQLRNGQELTVIYTSRDNLILGSGMRLKSNYEVVEQILDKEILKYIGDVFEEGDLNQ